MINNSCDGFIWVFVKSITNNDISTSKCSAYLLQEYAWYCSLRKEMFLFSLLCVPLFLWLQYLQKNIAECSGAKIVQLMNLPHNSVKAFLFEALISTTLEPGVNEHLVFLCCFPGYKEPRVRLIAVNRSEWSLQLHYIRLPSEMPTSELPTSRQIWGRHYNNNPSSEMPTLVILLYFQMWMHGSSSIWLGGGQKLFSINQSSKRVS